MASPPPRARNDLFDAVATVCGIDLGALTPSAGSVLGKVSSDLRKVGATPADVEARARAYLERMPPGSTLTPTALAKHWPSLGQSSAPRANGARALTRNERNWQTIADTLQPGGTQ